MKFHIGGMKCGGCVAKVTKAIKSVDPDAGLDVDLETKLVTITSAAGAPAIAQALADAGYTAERRS